ncbi:hypothetical protein [Patulibacter sp.]|uniref:hypothetical protein n=1 Tax=Patulibacter sp. TaxID=1912859 RepID=UPI002716FFA7|nr:hypothetical protein [Patulibacter sp.]MDO9410683.1 hypothetical protein [Patulibacter sp.]
MSLRPSRTRPALAAGTAVLLALAATGCGSSDDESTTTAATTGGTTTTTATTAESGGGGTASGGAPAANEDAIRAALARGPESTKAAKTARITLQTSTAGITTKATGTLDLVEQRYLFTQTLGGGGTSGSGGSGGAEFQNYGEKDKVYIRIPGPGGWSVTDNPIEQSDPLAQVRQLEKAKITDIGDTKEVDGKTCREFSAELSLEDVLGQIDDPSFQELLKDAPSGAKVPVTTCIDDGGLAYSSTSEYDIKDVLGGAAAQLPSGRSSSKLTISDYGTAPAPKRPAGIDDAKPLGTGTTAPSAG